MADMDRDPWLDLWAEPHEPPTVDDSERETWCLYGPNGEVLLTFSDRPPCGFHQGQRGVQRRDAA